MFFPPGVHDENLVGFLEVKPTKGWRSPGVSGFHASPLSTSSDSPNLPLSTLTNVWLLWLLLQVIRSWPWLSGFACPSRLWWWFFLKPQFSDGSNKSCWLSHCPAFSCKDDSDNLQALYRSELKLEVQCVFRDSLYILFPWFILYIKNIFFHCGYAFHLLMVFGVKRSF